MFHIFAIRLDKQDEQYSIEIDGELKIKGIMKQFKHEYMQIIDNLRIMDDALVLLNPAKRTARQPDQPEIPSRIHETSVD